MADQGREKITEALLSEALGELEGWIRPSTRKCVGPNAPNVFADFEAMLNKFKVDARAAFNGALLDGFFGVEGGQSATHYNPLLDRDGVLHHLACDLNQLKLARPPWFAGGWSVHGRRPDWTYWKSSATPRPFRRSIGCGPCSSP